MTTRDEALQRTLEERGRLFDAVCESAALARLAKDDKSRLKHELDTKLAMTEWAKLDRQVSELVGANS